MEALAGLKSASSAETIPPAQPADEFASSNAVEPDIALALAWYEKARDLGSAEAARRLSQLSAALVPDAQPPK
jgi:hypothetical protein